MRRGRRPGAPPPPTRPATPPRPPADAAGRVLVVACGALAREIGAVTRAGAWSHLDLHCLPAMLHNHPDRIAPALADALDARMEAYGRTFVAYADCGTGGALRKVCEARGVPMIAGPHCYAFFEGEAEFAAHGETDAFYLTDFLARQFDAFVIEPLGLDRHPELRDAYFGNYRALVYLAQTDDAALTARARAAADRLGLTFERRFTGLESFAHALGPVAARA
ncbi:DUF1638 domain-containing protein [Jannaschia sp. LMIT008]|uniref:DUF1638 domain-containing protein n=1 Tax=Jannaschia maritima TaxID=3032585 RepID=UPI0028111960|nr:DUF1638 domain-containing protein [Jannaschia sp. LMIT008]